MTLNAEEALTFLKQSSTVTGDTVFTHLSEVLRHVLASKPNNAIDVLETSFLLKSTRFISSEGDKPLREGRDPKDVEAITAFMELFSTKEAPPLDENAAKAAAEAKAKKAAGGDDETEVTDDDATEATDTETALGEEEAAGNEFEAENLFADSVYLDAAGVGLGRSEIYMIMLAMRKLGNDPALGITMIRFFGKFFALQGNYYVFESTASEVEGGEESAASETTEGKEGTEEGTKEGEGEPKEKFFWMSMKDKIPEEQAVGINLNVYWVCTKLGEKCRKLPDVTPLQIRAARSIKKYLTGKLDSEVSAYPPFPGLEENFLRAQIARIAASTQIAPAGYFSGDGEGGALTKAEEWTKPADEELATPEAWVHKNLFIRKEGRCTEFELPEPEEGEETATEAEEEEEEEEKEEGSEVTEGEEGEEGEKSEEDEEKVKPGEEEPEEVPEALRSIDQDKEISEGLKPWSISSSSSMNSFKGKVISVRSLMWPGAFSVVTATGFCNIYVGWGVKNAVQPPPLPPKLQKEYKKRDLQESTELPAEPEKSEAEESTEGETESQAGTEVTEEEE